MHYPAATSTQGVVDIPYTETWMAMEECVDLGLVRNIGISSMSPFTASLHPSPLRLFAAALGWKSDDRLLEKGSRDTTLILPDQTRSPSTRETPLSSPERVL
jgi:hypothetical protein